MTTPATAADLLDAANHVRAHGDPFQASALEALAALREHEERLIDAAVAWEKVETDPDADDVRLYMTRRDELEDAVRAYEAAAGQAVNE